MRLDSDIRRVLEQLPPGSWSIRPRSRRHHILIHGRDAGPIGPNGEVFAGNRGKMNLIASIRRLARA